jgi:hypothetical protein
MAAITFIDEERRRLDLTKTELCRRAGIHVGTYVRIQKCKTSGTERTFEKLRNALAIAAQQAAH